MIKYLSLFSGIGAFEKALQRLEIPYELVGYCEIDKYASKAYSLLHSVPESMNFGDITQLDETQLPDDIDLITYGFPCQDISLGIKFQLVVYNLSADYMGVISVKNKVTDTGWSEAALVYWVTGAESGCAVNKSCQNKKYDGGFTVDTNYTQNELKAAIKAGEFTFHKVNGVVRVLEDINSMVTTSDTCGDVFKDNQTIRVIDQLGNDDAVLFNTKYLGVVPNNASGRTSLWSDLVKIRTQLQELGAIEGFTDSDVTVAQGDSKKAVVITSAITVVNAMGKLYETVTVA